jgi:hypothetical protein
MQFSVKHAHALWIADAAIAAVDPIGLEINTTRRHNRKGIGFSGKRGGKDFHGDLDYQLLFIRRMSQLSTAYTSVKILGVHPALAMILALKSTWLLPPE